MIAEIGGSAMVVGADVGVLRDVRRLVDVAKAEAREYRRVGE